MKALHRSTIAAVVIVSAASPASALTGGGTAPGGPLSGSIRPACNGYNMDGTVNTSPGAERPGCADQSARSIRRPTAEQQPRD